MQVGASKVSRCRCHGIRAYLRTRSVQDWGPNKRLPQESFRDMKHQKDRNCLGDHSLKAKNSLICTYMRKVFINGLSIRSVWHNYAPNAHDAMQVKVRELVSTAAVATAALIRFLQGYASRTRHHEGKSAHHSAMLPASITSKRTNIWSLVVRVSHFFRQWQSSVNPIVSQTGRTQRLSEIPHECLRLLAEPLPPPIELTNYLESFPSASQAASLHAYSEAMSACVTQQTACIVGHLRPASHASLLSNSPGVLGHRSERNEDKVTVMKSKSLSDVAATLMSSQPCEELGVVLPGSMHRTMLACEGIAVNCLFDLGKRKCRVCHLQTSPSCQKVHFQRQ
jgi:hypothetical protein